MGGYVDIQSSITLSLKVILDIFLIKVSFVPPCSRVQRKVTCNAEGVKSFVRNASEKAAVLAASALIAGVRVSFEIRYW